MREKWKRNGESGTVRILRQKPCTERLPVTPVEGAQEARHMAPCPYPGLLRPLAWLAGRNLGAPSPAAPQSPQAVGSRGYTLCVIHFCVGTHSCPSISPPRTVSQAPGCAAAGNSKILTRARRARSDVSKFRFPAPVEGGP